MIDNNDIASFKFTPEWIGGFFDGEGCIGVYINRSKNYYRLEVKFSQKDPLILAWILLQLPYATMKKGHNVFELYFSAKESQIKFLEFIKDYSIIKRTQILLALDFLYERGNNEDISQKLKNEKPLRKERTDFLI